MGFFAGVFGHYTPSEWPMPYDCVIANSFGTVTGQGSVNDELRHLAERASVSMGYKDLIMDETLSLAPSRFAVTPAMVVNGPVSDMVGVGVGTWGVLKAAKKLMDDRVLKNPLLIGHAAHISRIAIQAKRLGINPVVPFGMPVQFDRSSSQLWTRSLALWVPREVVGAGWLKITGKL